MSNQKQFDPRKYRLLIKAMKYCLIDTLKTMMPYKTCIIIKKIKRIKRIKKIKKPIIQNPPPAVGSSELERLEGSRGGGGVRGDRAGLPS